MDEIELAVVLPEGARPLNAYGRNYAFSGDDKVVATYLVPEAPLDRSKGCEVMSDDFKWRRCSKEEIAKAAVSDARTVAAQTPAGQRRWYDSRRSLPDIYDGGCMQVTVEYDMAIRQVLRATCNGYA